MRIEEVLETAEEINKSQLESAYMLLQSHYDINSREIDGIVTAQFRQLFEIGAAAQQKGKGAINYLSISYLHSSVVTGSGEFHLALYDERLYFDDDPVYLYWSPSFLWAQYKKDMEKIEHALKDKIFRLKPYELAAVKSEYAGRYFEICHKMIADYMPIIIAELENSALVISPDFTVTYGGYRDTASVLFLGVES